MAKEFTRLEYYQTYLVLNKKRDNKERSINE
jgi:hypothetical protein